MGTENKVTADASMEQLMKEIKEVTKKQKSASRVDEIRVMKTMLNDKNFSVSIYDKNKGYIGQRSPREEAVKFVANVSAAVTGLDSKSAQGLAENYEFTKKDAIFLIENSRDFTQTYLQTGRKMPIVQGIDSEASIFCKPVQSKEKTVPAKDGEGTKTTTVPSYTKVVCRSKSPKYNQK